MQRIILTVIIFMSFVTSIAQVDKNAILEKLRSELILQTKNKDYNLYRYAREEHILSCLEVRISYESADYCDKVKKVIENFHEVDTKGQDDEKVEYIRDISFFQCQEVYDFLEYQIKNNLSEKVRCDAIMYLSWSLNPDYLPCILEYARRDSLSTQEKLALATSFTIFSVYTSNSELKEEAIKFLDEICYESSLNIFGHCDGCYFKLGEKAAVNYYNSQLEREKSKKISVATYRLVQLGEYKTTFPIFEEAIHSGVINNILEAIDGLKVIGTEEALRLIEEQTQSKNEKIAKYAQETLKNFELKRREK
jgi:hypothetical protein